MALQTDHFSLLVPWWLGDGLALGVRPFLLPGVRRHLSLNQITREGVLLSALVRHVYLAAGLER